PRPLSSPTRRSSDLTASHDFEQPGMPLTAAKITIGEDAFIAARAFVLPGVTIGARSIIGACSVVTHDIPENVIAAGNPCKVLHRSEEHTSELQSPDH